MSNVSGASSGTSIVRARGRVVGVPSKCWCGFVIVEKISKSDANPYRRYYRCAHDVARKLINDNHTFKWVDEALLDEIETLALQTERIEQGVKEITTERMELEKMVFEKMQMKLEKDVLERVEDVLLEAKSSMKKMVIGVVFGCMVMFGLMKLVD